MFLTPPSLDHDRLTAALDAVLAAAPTRGGGRPQRAVRIVGARTDGEVDLADVLSRAATRVAMAEARCGEMHSSVASLHVDPLAGRCLAALVTEIGGGMLCTPFTGRARLYVACAWEDDLLVLAVASPELASHPVPTAAAVRSLGRAGELAAALGGGLVRGVSDGVMLYAATFPWRVREGALGRQGRS